MPPIFFPEQATDRLPPLERTNVLCIMASLPEDAGNCVAMLQPLTTSAEHTRASTFVHSADAARHLLGRALLRMLLRREFAGRKLPDSLPRNAWGKPELPGSGIEFSISHAGQSVWLAMTRAAPVGIDVEMATACHDPLPLIDALHPRERAEIRHCATAEAARHFLRCWTRKEAVVKATGRGLFHPLDSFCVSTDKHPQGWLQTPPFNHLQSWSCHDLPTPHGYHASLAAMHSGLSLTCHLFPPTAS